MNLLTSNTQQDLKVVVAGGCHVYGWPIGDTFGFVQVCLGAEPNVSVSTVAPVNLRNCSKLLNHLRQQPADILILQFGNYETLASVKKHVRCAFHLKRPNKSSSSCSKKLEQEKDRGVQLPPDTVFRPTIPWRLRVLSKQLYSIATSDVVPPLFDANGFRLRCRQLLLDIAQTVPTPPQHIVFLSPIPCADHLICGYRLQAAEIIQHLCTHLPALYPAKVHFFDSAKAVGVRNSVSQSYAARVYSDDLHLNRHGHQLLGDALAAVLHNAVLEDAPQSIHYNIPSRRQLPLTPARHL